MNKKYSLEILFLIIIISIIIMGIVIIDKKKNTNNDENIYNTSTNANQNAQTKVEIDNNTISPSSVSITIINNNENITGCGVEFKIQKKVDGKWEDLEYISNDLTWIDIAYKFNEENKITQKLDIEKYYGKLPQGIYRVVKPVYGKTLYSNEFEIK